MNQPFVFEQVESLKRNYSVEVDYFLIKGKGLFGYIYHIFKLNRLLYNRRYDLIHAHYGICGFIAICQIYLPVVVTFHGSDVNEKFPRILSLIARKFAQAAIFVSSKMMQQFESSKMDFLVPCGIDLEKFYAVDKVEALTSLRLNPKDTHILFGASFDNPVKNAKLAVDSVNELGRNVNLIELKNKDRNEVRLLLSAVDLLLLTSLSEGSPQIIKEAMACNCPIVSTDVGDIREVIVETSGCFLTSFNKHDVAEKIAIALESKKRTEGRKRILHFDNNLIAKQIFEIYNKVISDNTH